MTISLKKKIFIFFTLLFITIFLSYFLTGFLFVYESEASINEPSIIFTGNIKPVDRLILEIDNHFDGPMWIIPNTYTLYFNINRSVTIGLVLIYGEDYDDGVFYDNFEIATENTDKIIILELESIGNNESSNKISIDVPNGQDYFVLTMFFFDLSNDLNIEIDLSKSVNSELEFPYTDIIFITLVILQIGFLFSTVFSTRDNSKNKFEIFNHKLQKYAIDILIFIILLISLYSKFFQNKELLSFWYILLLFFGFYKSKAMETIFGFEVNKGFNILSSLYLTSLIAYSDFRNKNFNVSSDDRTVSFLVYLGVDFIAPLFWITVFFMINSILNNIQGKLNNIKDNTSNKIIRWLMSVSFVICLEVSLTFYDILNSIVSIFTSNASIGNQILEAIGILWSIIFTVKILRNIKRKLRKNSVNTEDELHPILFALKFPEFDKIRNSVSSVPTLVLVLYNVFLLMQWIIVVNQIIVHYQKDILNQSILFYLTNLVNAIGLISGIFYIINFYLLWSIGIKYSSLSYDKKDGRYTRAYTLNYTILHIHFFGGMIFFGISAWFPIDLNEAILMLSIEIITLFIVLLMFKSKDDEGYKLSNTLKSSVWIIILLSNVIAMLLIPALFIITYLYISATFFIFIAGYILIRMTNILLAFFKGDFEPVQPTAIQYFSDIIIAIIGFLYYIILDPLSFGIAVKYFGGFLFFIFVGYKMLKTMYQKKNDPKIVNIQSKSKIKVLIISLFVLGYMYIYVYAFDNYTLGDPIEYLMLIIIALIDVMMIYVFTMPLESMQSQQTSRN